MTTGINRSTFQSGFGGEEVTFQAEGNLPLACDLPQPFLQHSAATQALRVRIPQRDTIRLFDPTLFPFKSTLVFACLLFCKTKTIFLTSPIQTLNHAKQN